MPSLAEYWRYNMPNITDFDASNLQLRPTELGVEAYTQAGRRIGAFYNQVGETKGRTIERLGAEAGQDIRLIGDTAVNYLDHQQINAGADKLSQFFVNQTQDMEKTLANADVHDPSVAQKWRDQVFEPAAQQFLDSGFFTTEKSKQWANEKINTLRQHFFVQSEAEMSRIAKVAVDETLGNMATNYSNAAVANPASVDTSIALLSSKLDDVLKNNPNIKGSDAAEIKANYLEKAKRQIIQSGALSAIMKSGDPEAAAAAWASNPKYKDYINGTEALQLSKAATIQAKQNLLLQKEIENERTRQAENGMHQSLNDTFSKVTYGPDGKPQFGPDFVKDLNDLPSKFPNAPNAWATKRELGNFLESEQQKAAKEATAADKISDPATLAALKSEVDPQKLRGDLIAARRAGKLNNDTDFKDLWSTANDLEKQPVETPIFKSAVDAVKISMGADSTKVDAKSAERFSRFMSVFVPEYQREAASGKDMTNALDLHNPDSLISRAMSPFSYSLSDAMYRLAAGQSTFEPPREGTWQWNAKIKQYRDPAGTLYDENGVIIKPAGK